MNFIQARSEKSDLPKVHCFNTFFFTKLATPANKGGGYESVKRWTRRVDIFSLDILIIPIHLGAHWVCGVVDFRNKSIFYFDSLHGLRSDYFHIISDYLNKESQAKKNTDFDVSTWNKIAPKVHLILFFCCYLIFLYRIYHLNRTDMIVACSPLLLPNAFPENFLIS